MVDEIWEAAFYSISNDLGGNFCKAIPIKCFVSHHPTDPFFWKSEKKIQNHLWRSKFFSLQAQDLVLLTPIVLNSRRYFVFVAF